MRRCQRSWHLKLVELPSIYAWSPYMSMVWHASHLAVQIGTNASTEIQRILDIQSSRKYNRWNESILSFIVVMNIVYWTISNQLLLNLDDMLASISFPSSNLLSSPLLRHKEISLLVYRNSITSMNATLLQLSTNICFPFISLVHLLTSKH